jgi:hypothetical protein
MGKAGRQLIAHDYTWERKAELFDYYYKQITATKNFCLMSESIPFGTVKS